MTCRTCGIAYIGRTWCSRCYGTLPPMCNACREAHRRVAPLLCPACVDATSRRGPRGHAMRYRVTVTYADGLAGARLNVRSALVAEAIRQRVLKDRPDARVEVEAR